MILLASCTPEQCNNFNGKLVIPNEDNKKPDKVLLNVILEKGQSIPKNAYCVTYKGKEVGDILPEKTFMEVPFDELESVEPVDGVVTLVRLPEEYCNMRELLNICSSRPDVRFIGGNLLGIDGVRIGRFDDGKEKMSPVFKDIYDSFVEVDLGDLDGLQEIVKKTRKKAESTGEKKSKKASKDGNKTPAKKKNSKIEVFGKLFGGNCEEF